MDKTQPNTANLLFGGILVGIWIFWAMTGAGDTAWVIGGLIGFGIAGAAYAAQQAGPDARTPIYIGLGLVVGFTVMGLAVTGEIWEIIPGLLAFLLATLGAMSIINGLPQPIAEAEPSGA